MDEFKLFPEQGSEFAAHVDALFLFITAVAAFFSLLIAGLIVYFSIRYRRQDERQFANATQSALGLEITWTAIPLGLTMVMFVWGAQLYFSANHPPPDAMDIHVVGKQWMWKIQHPEGRREINELHVPLGKAVRLVLISQDVIHDFYLPDFRVKQDVLPGRYTYTWFRPTKLGESHLYCAQYCGTQHANMVGRVFVMEPAEYAKWLRGQSQVSDSMLENGERLYRQFACHTCHGVKAPTLAGLYGSTVKFSDGSTTIADESYLRDHILNPRNRTVSGYQSIMPTYKGQMSEDQLIQIITYIKSLSDMKAREEKP